MNLDLFITWAPAQGPLLYAPSPAREGLRGQCVQLVCYYVVMVANTPVIWADAVLWFKSGLFPEAYSRVLNDHANPNQVPPRGALIVWDSSLPNSGDAGHIAVCVDAKPGAGTFVSLDQNWGGKTPHLVTHNWQYVVGWLVPKTLPSPAPQNEGDEMITTIDDAVLMYQDLRPNSGPTQDEINATVNKKTFHNFLMDTQAERAQRNANLLAQEQKVAELSTQINIQNQALSDFTLKLKDATASNTDKQKALDETLAKLGNTNAELTTLHDQIADLQKTGPTLPGPDSASWISKLLAILLRVKK